MTASFRRIINNISEETQLLSYLEIQKNTEKREREREREGGERKTKKSNLDSCQEIVNRVSTNTSALCVVDK